MFLVNLLINSTGGVDASQANILKKHALVEKNVDWRGFPNKL